MNIKNALEDAMIKSRGSSFFGKIIRRVLKLYLNIFVADSYEYYDYEEPSKKIMKNKIYWIQIIDKED